MQFEQVLAAEMRRRRAMAEQMANEEQILREARIWQQQAAAQGRRPAPRAEAIDFAVGPALPVSTVETARALTRPGAHPHPGVPAEPCRRKCCLAATCWRRWRATKGVRTRRAFAPVCRALHTCALCVS